MLDRGCHQLGWVALNGHCVSDPLGCITCVHGHFTSVIDLAIVLHMAHDDVAVLPICADGCNHRALLVTVLAVPSCCALSSPLLPSAEVLTVRPVWVKFTSEDAMVFRSFDWLQVADSVLTMGNAAYGPRTAGDYMLEAFEEVVLVHMAACKQATAAALHWRCCCCAVVPQ